MRQLIFSIVFIVLSILLSAAILLQQRGSGLGATFGGDGNVFRTKRGLEKFLLYATWVSALVFFILAVVNVRLALAG
jgi:protein translocase SecG subunit